MAKNYTFKETFHNVINANANARKKEKLEKTTKVLAGTTAVLPVVSWFASRFITKRQQKAIIDEYRDTELNRKLDDLDKKAQAAENTINKVNDFLEEVDVK